MSFNKSSKKILLGLVSLVVLLSCVEFGVRADDTSKIVYDPVENVATTYRGDTNNYSYPDEKEGFVFAGWYKESESGNSAYVPMTETEANSATKAYAKYVPVEVLSVKAQVNEAALKDEITNANRAAIRLLTTVDSRDYEKVGFSVHRADKDYTYNLESTGVFRYVRAIGTTDSAYDETFTPETAFCADSHYFESVTFANMPNDAVDIELTATPYWVTQDGTKVEGKSSIKTVNLGRSWVYVDSESTSETELGTKNAPYKSLDKTVEHPSEIAMKAIIKNSDDTKIENITLDNAIMIDKTYPVTIASEAEATISRGNLANAMFSVSEGAKLILDGTLTLDGRSSSSNTATEAMLLNKGTLTINSNVTVKNGYKSGTANTVIGETTGKSGGAIESNGVLNVSGIVTACGSGNYNAISVIGGDFTSNGAQLIDNEGRAIRIVYGTAIIEDTIMNKNDLSSGSGGALLLDYATVKIVDSYFVENSSAANGGAIYITNAACQLSMEGCTIKNNTAKSGTGGGITIEANSDVTMTECIVSGNNCKGSSKQGGGIWLNTATLTLDGCTVESNGATGAGGGIRIGAEAILTLQGKTKILDNTASSTSYGTQIWVNDKSAIINWGSEVEMSTANLEQTTYYDVGMIGLNHSGVNIVLTGPIKDDNCITIKGRNSGANTLVENSAILSGNNPWIEDAVDNFVIVNPTGLRIRMDGKTVSNTVTPLAVTSWGELKTAIESATTGTVLEAVLDSNITSTNEGVITVPEGVKVILTDKGNGYSITRTVATETEVKDALFKVVDNAEMILAGSITLDGTSSSTAVAKESLILNKGTLTVNSNVTIQNGYKESKITSLDETKTSLSGGAIESNGILNIYGTITACGSGNNSAISVLDGTFTAIGAKLNANQGRAARIVDGSTIFTNVELINNVASDIGAGLLIDYATVTIKGGSISSNQATGNGGAIVVQSTASLEISDCMINSNHAIGNGGAVSITTSGEVTFTNCKIGVDGENKAGNKASEQGGAFYIKGDCTVTLNGCTVANNESVKRGGAVRIDKGTLNANDSHFNSNYGKQSGGALFVYEYANVELSSCDMNQNSSSGDGQTIHVMKSKYATPVLALNNCMINDKASENADEGEIYNN